MRRGRPPRQGQWSLPGGAQRLGETQTEAAAREVLEETGLGLAQLELLTTLDIIEHDEDGRVRFHYSLVDFTAEAGEGTAIPATTRRPSPGSPRTRSGRSACGPRRSA